MKCEFTKNLENIMVNAGKIQRIGVPSQKDFFKFFVVRFKPVIFNGAMKYWPALKSLTPYYVESTLGYLRAFIQVKEKIRREKSR